MVSKSGPSIKFVLIGLVFNCTINCRNLQVMFIAVITNVLCITDSKITFYLSTFQRLYFLLLLE